MQQYSLHLFDDITELVILTLDKLATKEEVEIPDELINRITLEPPRDQNHGEMSSNVAMVCAKIFKRKPIDLAYKFVCSLKQDQRISNIDIVRPGFINLTLQSDIWYCFLHQLMQTPEHFVPPDLGQKTQINVEYVSANPTGPLHLGHIRGAVFGDVLANILEACNYRVVKEYYVNDAGGQIDILTRSAMYRYLEALGYEVGEMESDMYPGQYLKVFAAHLSQKFGTRFIDDQHTQADRFKNISVEFRALVVDGMLSLIKDDLASLGIHQQVFTSERELVERGSVDEAFKKLYDDGLIYQGVLPPPKGKIDEEWEAAEQTIFRSTDFGDDSDRVLKKSDGSWTYFASDVANHYHKYKRGFNLQINVFGADHAGYICRLRSVVKALSKDQANLEVLVCQMVRLIENGKPYKMSKRAGNFVTLRELVQLVGKDATRFFMLMRRNDAALNFDLDLARSTSHENPIFYVQYAHARTFSLEKNMRSQLGEAALERARNASLKDLHRLTRESEMHLIRKLAQWPRLMLSSARTREPHRLAYYLIDLASLFHRLWNEKSFDGDDMRFIIAEDLQKSCARIALALAVRMVLAKGLNVISIQPCEELR
ncbi:MAG: arginine--tRNA ligase [Pseudomonadota bacterium]